VSQAFDQAVAYVLTLHDVQEYDVDAIELDQEPAGQLEQDVAPIDMEHFPSRTRIIHRKPNRRAEVACWGFETSRAIEVLTNHAFGDPC
jgi:hypothetical protein